MENDNDRIRIVGMTKSLPNYLEHTDLNIIFKQEQYMKNKIRKERFKALATIVLLLLALIATFTGLTYIVQATWSFMIGGVINFWMALVLLIALELSALLIWFIIKIK